MLALSNVMHFLPDKLAGLRARRLSFPGILASTFNGFFFRHLSSMQMALKKFRQPPVAITIR